MSTIRKFIDISANLTDPMFFGIYNGSKKHKCDMVAVLERAFSNGLKKIILPGGSLRESTDCIELSRCDGSLFCTVGCHPTRCNEFEQSGSSTKYLEDLLKLAKENVDKVVAIGECGLDYDRLHFCSKEVQIRFFELQLQLSKELQLPLLLHCRNAASDLIEILKRNADGLCGGVVHSFDGSEEDAKTFLELGYYIGINGCSLKTKQNLDVMATIPSNRLMIETDCPWCEVRPSHAGFKYIKTTFSAVKKEKWIEGSMVKGRCEPSHVTQVAEIMAGIRNEDITTLCNTLYENSEKLFFQKKCFI